MTKSGITALERFVCWLDILDNEDSRHYVYGCFYWLIADDEESKLLVLDTQKMEFSLVEPPPETNSSCNFEMVEAGEGRPGMFVLPDSGSDLSYFIRQNDGGSQIKVKTISLDSWAQFICSMENYLLLYQGQTSLLEPGCFTLDIKTFELEKVCTLGSTFYLRAYSNFPHPCCRHQQYQAVSYQVLYFLSNIT